MEYKKYDMNYFVVKFANLPDNCLDRYVCVPRSWIKLFAGKVPQEQKVVVSYPAEEPQKTRERVINSQECDRSWKHYWASLEYTTDEYQDAERWIASALTDGSDNADPEYSYIGNPSNQDTEPEAHSHQQNIFPTPEGNHSQPNNASSKNKQNAAIKLSLKRKLLPNTEEFYVKRLRIDENSEDQHNNPDVNLVRQIQEPCRQDITTTTASIEHGSCYQSPYYNRMSMPSTVQASPNPHNSKIIQKRGKHNENIHLHANYQEKYFQTQTPTTSIDESYQTDVQRHQKRIAVVSNDYLFQNRDDHELGTERAISTGNNHENAHADMTNTSSTNNSNQAYQTPSHVTESAYQNLSLGDPNNYMLQPAGKQGLESFAVATDYERKNNLSSRNTPSAVQALQILLNRREESRNALHENQTLMENESMLCQESHKQELYYTQQPTSSEDTIKQNIAQQTTTKFPQQLHVGERSPPHVNSSHTFNANKNNIDDKTSTQYMVKKGLSAEKSLTGDPNHPSQLVEQPHLNQDVSGYNVHVHINKIVVSNSNDRDCDNQMASPQSVTIHSPATLQNNSNCLTEPSELHGKLIDNQDPSEYSVVVQQDPLINKIIITRSDMDGGNGKIHPQSTVDGCQSSEHLHDRMFSAASMQYTQRNPGAQQRVIRTTTAGIPYIVNDYFPENVKNAPPDMQHCPNLQNQSYKSSKSLNNQHSKPSQNSPPRTEIPTVINAAQAADRVDQRPRLQNIRKHRQIAPQNLPPHIFWENKIRQFTDSFHEKQSLPIRQDHLVQNCSAREQFVRQTKNSEINSRPYLHENIRNTSLEPKHPIITNHSYLRPENLPEYVYGPIHSDYVLKDPRVRENSFVRTTAINTINQRQQTMHQNAPVVQNIANHLCCACRCSNVKRTAPVVQSYSYEEPPRQQVYIGKPAERRHTQQIIHPHINAHHKPLTNEHFFGTTTVPNATYANATQDRFVLNLGNSTAEEIGAQKKSAPKYADVHYIGQPIYSKNTTDDNSSVVKKSPETRDQLIRSSTEKNISPTYKKTSDQDIQAEVIFLAEPNDANNAKQNIQIGNVTKSSPTAKEGTINVGNSDNSKIMSEYALMNLKSICSQMDSNLRKTYTLIDNANKIFVEYAESFKKTMKVVNEYYELKVTEIAGSIIEKKNKDKRHKKKKLEKYNDLFGDDEEPTKPNNT